jgi:hypothetical protein
MSSKLSSLLVANVAVMVVETVLVVLVSNAPG